MVDPEKRTRDREADREKLHTWLAGFIAPLQFANTLENFGFLAFGGASGAFVVAVWRGVFGRSVRMFVVSALAQLISFAVFSLGSLSEGGTGWHLLSWELELGVGILTGYMLGFYLPTRLLGRYLR